MRIKYIFIILLILIPSCLNAQRPIIPAVMVSERPVLDGDLSDPCWKQAPSVSDFYITADSSKAVENTTAWLCYDQDNIYLAFYCKESQPDTIMVQQKKRGGDIGKDDWIGFNLDAYNNCERYVWFNITAGGIQTESLQSGNVEKIEWRGDWHSSAKRVDDGYTVEIAVPFSILQYDANQTSMGISFVRRHARTAEKWWSPDLGPNDDIRNYYIWDGLKLPKLKNRPVMLAYSLVGVGEGASPKRVGLDIKHSITPNLSGIFTLNPDFISVQQQVDSTSFSYSEREQSESRPFFEESNSYFPDNTIFYSRRIEEIDYGAKLSGRMAGLNVGLMQGGQFKDDNFSVFRAERIWAGKGLMNIAGTRNSKDGIDTQSQYVRGMYRLYDKNDHRIEISSIWGQADSASGLDKGRWSYSEFSKSGPPHTLSWSIERESISPDYDPPLAYVSDRDLQTWRYSVAFRDEPSSGKFEGWNIGAGMEFADRYDGSLYYNARSISGHCHLRNGTGISLSTGEADRVWPDNNLYNDRSFSVGYWWGDHSLFRKGGVQLTLGNYADGDYLYYKIYQGRDLSSRISVSASYEHSRLEEPSPDAYSLGQLVAAISYELDPERLITGRLVSRGGKNNFFLSYGQRVRSGLDIYVLFGDPNAETTKNSIIIKAIRPL